MRAHGSNPPVWRTLAELGLSALTGALAFALLVAAGLQLFGPLVPAALLPRAAASVPGRRSATVALAPPHPPRSIRPPHKVRVVQLPKSARLPKNFSLRPRVVPFVSWEGDAVSAQPLPELRPRKRLH